MKLYFVTTPDIQYPFLYAVTSSAKETEEMVTNFIDGSYPCFRDE